MAMFKIKCNAIEAGMLIGCIQSTSGSKGHNRVKDDWLQRFLDTWKELDGSRDDVVRIDDRSKEAKERREFEMDTIEQGVFAEAFLAAVRPADTKAAAFGLYRRSAKVIQVSRWFDEQTKETISPFAGQADDPAPTAYADQAQNASEKA